MKSIDRAHEYSVAELESIIRQLSLSVDIFREFLELANATETKTIVSHNRRTLERALNNLSSSVSAIQRSMLLHRTGTPLKRGELKPRSTGDNNSNEGTKRGRKAKTNG